MFAKYFQISKFSNFDPKILKHNIIMHIGDGAGFAFAIGFISPTTILPIFIEKIGGNAIAIGAIPILWTVGANFPQFFFGQQKYNEKLVKPVMLRYVIIHRISFLVLGIFTFFFLEYIPSTILVPLVLALLCTTAILGSVPGPRWVTYFAKTTPTKLRGRLLSVRLLLSSALGMIAGSVIIVILSTFKYPHNFAILFFACFVFLMISYFFLKNVNEPEEKVREDNSPVKIKKFQKAVSLIKENERLRNYLIADSLLLISLTASAFYEVYAIGKFQLPTSYAGSFTIILMGGMVLGNIIFGYIGDVFGHKVNLTIMAASLVLANFTALISINPLTYGIVFVFVAFAQGLQGVSRLAFIVELTGETNTTLYASLLNSATAPTAIFGIIAGIIISFVGYPIVFGIYGLISIFAIYWIYKKVIDPRQVLTNEAA
jgi:MFS family permease